MTLHHIHPYFDDEQVARLDEETYKDLIGEITNNNIPGAILHNLPHRDWSPLIKFVRYYDHEGDIFKFYVPNKYNGWFTFVQFVDWNEQLKDQSLKANEAARLLLWAGNLRLYCNCPAFKFWGMQYILTQLDASIIPEPRYPHIRNPNLKGIVCKHLNRCLKVLPFHLGDIAKAFNHDRENLKKDLLT